jgi:hypothetical protein
MGNRDFVEYIAEELHFYSDFGPSTAQNTWGCGLISAFPIERVDRIVLPSPEGELACLIDADLRVSGEIVNVLVTHFGNTEDVLDLELQTNALSALIHKRAHVYSPTILIGYLTTEPYTDRFKRIISAGLRDTTDSWDRYCLYGLYRDLQFVSFERIDKGSVSDTEAQVSTFLVNRNYYRNNASIGGGTSTTSTPSSTTSCNSFAGQATLCQGIFFYFYFFIYYFF